MSPLIWCTISRFIRHWQDLQLQHGRQAEYTAPQLPIVHKAAENLCASQMGQDIKAVYAEYLFMQQRLCWCLPEWLWITPTTYARNSAYCLKSHGGVRGIYASLWRFLLRCTLFCQSVATFFDLCVILWGRLRIWGYILIVLVAFEILLKLCRFSNFFHSP